jgi:zinc protease
VARTDDGNVAGAWTHYLDLGRTFAFSAQTESRIRAATREQVNAAIRRYLDPARLSVFVAGDPTKGAK